MMYLYFDYIDRQSSWSLHLKMAMNEMILVGNILCRGQHAVSRISRWCWVFVFKHN